MEGEHLLVTRTGLTEIQSRPGGTFPLNSGLISLFFFFRFSEQPLPPKDRFCF